MTRFAEKVIKTSPNRITFVKGVFLLMILLIVLFTGIVIFLNVELIAVSSEFNRIVVDR